jgi:hypothetical protein
VASDITPDCDGTQVLRTLQRDTWAYAVSLGPLGLGGLALLPLMTQVLSPAELGWLAVAEALMLPASTLGMMGLKFAYLYRFAHSTPQQQRHLMATCLALGSLISLACGLAAMVLATHPALLGLVGWNGGVPLQQPWLLAAQVPVGTVQALFMTELRAQRRVRETAVVSYAQLGATLAATAGFTWLLPWGLDGFMAGALAGQVVGLAGVWGVLWWPSWAARRVGTSDTPAAMVQWAEAPALLRYGWPLTAGLLVSYGMDGIARLLLAGWATVEAAAEWLVVTRVLSVFDVLVANPFFMAWGGLVHHVLRRPDAAEVARIVSRWTMLNSSVAVVVMVALDAPITVLMSGEAQPGLEMLFLLLLWSRWMAVVKSPLCCGVQRYGDTKWIFWNNLMSLAIFVLAMLSVRSLETGMKPAICIATSVTLANLVQCAMLYRQSNKFLDQQHAATTWGILIAAAVISFSIQLF